MIDIPRVERIDSTPFQTHPEQNVHGWERAASLAGGVLMMGKGLRRGGFFGLIQLVVGTAVLARGITGQCAAKSLLEKGRRDMTKARTQIDRVGAELSQLKTRAEIAAEQPK
ncbi:MAG: YgaP family membrane protein [Pseudomonas sp.]